MKVTESRSLKDLNSFGVEARAARFAEWETTEELVGLFAEDMGEWMAIGGGNNILFTRDYEGTLIHCVSQRIAVSGETAEAVCVRADAGTDWDEFVMWCIGRGVWGAENLSGIPGTVGACPIQNIGAYGAEAKDIIVSVECFCPDTGNILNLAGEYCAFGYRDSIFKRELKGRVIITAVDFRLWKEPRPNLGYHVLAEKVAGAGEPTLGNIRNAIIAIRDNKLPDPKVTGNAGSFFKNPVVDDDTAHRLAAGYPAMPLYPSGEAGKTKLAAGWLIDRAGWKGRSEGRVAIHCDQALVVVNLGGATGAEIAAFARRVQDDIRAKFGISLETEVNII